MRAISNNRQMYVKFMEYQRFIKKNHCKTHDFGIPMSRRTLRVPVRRGRE